MPAHVSNDETNNWREVRISDIIQPLKTVTPSKQPNTKIEYIDVSSVNRETYSVEQTQILLGSEAPSRARRVVRKGDVLFATVRPTLKRVTIIPEELDGAICSTGYFVLSPTNEVLSGYLFYYLLGERFSREMEALQRGASYPAVSDKDVKDHIILLPSLETQERIVNILDETFSNTKHGKENARLQILLFESLEMSSLNEAFSGRL